MKKDVAIIDNNQNFFNRIVHYVCKYDFIFIFLLIFFIYNITTKMSLSGDTFPAEILPFMILNDNSVYFDGSIQFIVQQKFSVYPFILTHGHYASIFPIVTGVIVTPFYIVHKYFILLFPSDFNYLGVLSKFSATILTAIAGTVFYLVCKKLFELKIALLTTIIFALGTLTWSISAQALWQHGTSELLLIIALYCIIRNEEKRSKLNFIILGLVSGLYLFNRPSDALILFPIIYYVWLNREELINFLSGCIVSGFPFFWYNEITFGNFFGGYGETPLSSVINGLFTPLSIFSNVLGQFFSPNRGLFIFCPILIFALWGYYTIYRERVLDKIILRRLLLLFLPFMLGTVLIYSAFGDWGGGWSYGPRYMTGLLPILAIYTGFGISPFLSGTDQNLPIKRAIIMIIFLLLIISIIFQAVGAWAYPYTTWNENMTNEKLWDWSDTLIVSSYNAGVHNIDNLQVFIWPSLPPPIGYIQIYSKYKKT